MRIGMIGIGGIAGGYRSSLSKIQGVAITAVCDVNRERADAAADAHGAKAYYDHETMMDSETFDALFISIPPFAHTTQELIAAERKIPFFIAKPVGLCLDTSKKVRDAVRRSGILTNVGYMWRHHDLTDRAKALIGDRKIGMALGYTHVNTPGTPWWRVYSESGGQIVEQSTHIFDLARYFCGEAIEVQAWGGNRLNPAIDFEDVTTVNMRFENGAVGNISSTSLVRTGRYALELIGADFHLEIDFSGNRLRGHLGDERIDEQGVENGYGLQVVRFIDAVRDGKSDRIRSTYEDGVKTLALTLAANESIHTGELIAVPMIE